MTLRQPNTQGIEKAAQKKREQTFERVNTAIHQLLKERKEISFATVSEVANVSRTWLYNNQAIRDKIEELRNQSSSKKTVPPHLKPSDSSKDTIIKTLKERVKKLEIENRGLRGQLEVVYGLANPELLNTIETQQLEIAELERQNQHLQKILIQARAEIDAFKQKKIFTKEDHFS
ncbi:DUF6262 family protein [Trichocoleus sp. FACHB-262]|uniref:DUF6262 family protein n=1 Tax=Trichocoleus sp. FACHB-262 TaxID=2692869 RepID=UPI001685DAB5|nr:DUF6262 family protein [Trichocoleus sp. FACHB-262]MBD2122408.1 hypothetical protein [Trichocoleus sp. FACHB-262]